MASPDALVIIVATELAPEDLELLLCTAERPKSLLILSDEAPSRPHGNVLRFDPADASGMRRAAKEWARKDGRQVAGILGLDEEYGYRLSTLLAQAFGVTHHAAETRRLVADKWTQRRHLAARGIRAPWMRLVTEMPSEIAFPNVLKPLTGVGGIATYRSDDRKELQHNLAAARRLGRRKQRPSMLQPFIMNGKRIDPGKTFLVEEFIPGEEFSCDYLVEDGRVELLRVVRKLPARFPYFAGFLLLPSSLEGTPFSRASLHSFCSAVASALGIRHGVCMMDFKWAGELVLIETSLRPGIAEFIDLQHTLRGQTSIDVAVRQLLGLPARSATNERSGLLLYLVAPHHGRLTRFDTVALERAAKRLGVSSIVKHEKAGALLSRQRDRPRAPIIIGHVLVECEVTDAERVAERIRSMVRIEVER